MGRGPESIYALREPFLFTHNVGLLTLQITNVGIIGNPFINDLSAGWRGGEYLFFSGLWIGAVGSDSETHVSTASPFELRPELGGPWTVYESYEGQSGGVRLGLLGPTAADDDNDDVLNEDFQNGLDDDRDGNIDEDYEAIGQQMFSCMYRDDTAEATAQISDHFPLNILVRQRSFQWSTTGLNEFVGFDFEIVNTGEQRLKQLYLGFFSDTDAGPKTADSYWTDDLVGWAHIDTTIVDRNKQPACQRIHLIMDTAFMWDAPDNGTSVRGGDVPGVFGSLFLGHTTDDTGLRAPQSVGLTTVAWFSASGQNSDPQNDDERYQLLAAGTKPNKAANKPVRIPQSRRVAALSDRLRDRRSTGRVPFQRRERAACLQGPVSGRGRKSKYGRGRERAMPSSAGTGHGNRLGRSLRHAQHDRAVSLSHSGLRYGRGPLRGCGL
jgi:hypothetical protein